MKGMRFTPPGYGGHRRDGVESRLQRVVGVDRNGKVKAALRLAGDNQQRLLVTTENAKRTSHGKSLCERKAGANAKSGGSGTVSNKRAHGGRHAVFRADSARQEHPGRAGRTAMTSGHSGHAAACHLDIRPLPPLIIDDLAQIGKPVILGSSQAIAIPLLFRSLGERNGVSRSETATNATCPKRTRLEKWPGGDSAVAIRRRALAPVGAG